MALQMRKRSDQGWLNEWVRLTSEVGKTIGGAEWRRVRGLVINVRFQEILIIQQEI